MNTKSNLYMGVLMMILLGTAETCGGGGTKGGAKKDPLKEGLVDIIKKYDVNILKQKLDMMKVDAIMGTMDPKEGGYNIMHILVKAGDKKKFNYVLNFRKEEFSVEGLLDKRNKEGDTPLVMSIKRHRSFDHFVMPLIDKSQVSLLIRDGKQMLPVEVAVIARRGRAVEKIIQSMDKKVFEVNEEGDALKIKLLEHAVKHNHSRYTLNLINEADWKLVNYIIMALARKGVYKPIDGVHKEFMTDMLYRYKEVKSDIIRRLPDKDPYNFKIGFKPNTV